MKKWMLWLAAVVLIGMAAAVGDYWRETLETRKSGIICKDCNIVMISASSLRRSHMGIYGYNRPTTPVIDEFFKNGLVFTHAFAPSVLTYTNALSMFYSVFPYTHQLMDRSLIGRSKRRLIDQKTFTELLRESGYSTMALVSDEDYNYKFGAGKGFERYLDAAQYRDYDIAFQSKKYNVGTKDLVRPAVEWLSVAHKDRFFLFLQNFDVHCPYNPGPEFRTEFEVSYKGSVNDDECYMNLEPVQPVEKDGRRVLPLESWFAYTDRKRVPAFLEENDVVHLKNMYDAELRQLDANLRPLFAKLHELDLMKKTIVVFLSEHGDYLGENGFFMRASLRAEGNLHNQSLGFPLLIHHPAFQEKKVISQLAQTVDIGPTLLEMVGVKDTRAMSQGQSLVPAIVRNENVNKYAYAASIRTRGQRGRFNLEAIQNHDWKLIAEKRRWSAQGRAKRTVQYKLYNLAQDPNEEKDVIGENREIAEALHEDLRDFLGRFEMGPMEGRDKSGDKAKKSRGMRPDGAKQTRERGRRSGMRPRGMKPEAPPDDESSSDDQSEEEAGE